MALDVLVVGAFVLLAGGAITFVEIAVRRGWWRDG